MGRGETSVPIRGVFSARAARGGTARWVPHRTDVGEVEQLLVLDLNSRASARMTIDHSLGSQIILDLDTNLSDNLHILSSVKERG